MNAADALREMDKVLNALTHAAEHHAKDSESKAALHMSDRVLYSPLATALITAQESAARLREHLAEQADR